MTFEEWWEANIHKFAQADYAASDYEEVARTVWNTAIEEAAKLCDGDHIVSGSNGPLMDHGYAMASAIHAKSIRKLSA